MTLIWLGFTCSVCVCVCVCVCACVCVCIFSEVRSLPLVDFSFETIWALAKRKHALSAQKEQFASAL